MSRDGLLLASDELLEVGRQGHISAWLAGRRVKLHIEICRMMDTGSTLDHIGRFRSGAIFVGPKAATLRSIEEYLQDQSPLAAAI